MDYRRAWVKGGCYFFTVVTFQRRPLLTLPENLDRLRKVFAAVKAKRPFLMPAIVILPDHLHCIWLLPKGDADFATRWRMIKHDFSCTCSVPPSGIAPSRQKKGEKAVWQRRYWEHLIRDENDWRKHTVMFRNRPIGRSVRSNGWSRRAGIRRIGGLRNL